mmetsp:Transcript_42414/g.102600  ORF Transcript_42414/g.102600 Transcript_42414/m.102600 type:complete len:146 (+) Transcript_42414:1408-1845(+)
MSNINRALKISDIHRFLVLGDKMSLCGAVPQTKEIRFKAQDNRKRDNATVTALMHIGQEEEPLSVVETDPFVYEFGFSHDERGVAILEVFVDGVQIPHSPIRVEVESRNCDTDFPGKRMVPVSTLFQSESILPAESLTLRIIFLF